MSTKQRVTVTLDPQLVRAGNAAVRRGRATSLSDWVNAAVAARVSEDKRLAAARRAVAALDRELGAMSEDEMETRVAKLRANAIRVRPGKRPPTSSSGRAA